ncbi:hypothetical protein IAU60_003576 [Kwoniella sp. DSM 27419]
MPVSSRRPVLSPQPYLAPSDHSHSSSGQSPMYTPLPLGYRRDPSPAPPYNGQPLPTPDPFYDTRALASGHHAPLLGTQLEQQVYSAAHAPSPVRVDLAFNPSSGRLPFFEAALARSRGSHLGEDNRSTAAPVYAQPLPSYLPPPDPNHPDLSIGFTQSSTVRFAQPQRYDRGYSRSPSPGLNDSFDQSGLDQQGEADVEKALLGSNAGQRGNGGFFEYTDEKRMTKDMLGVVEDAGDLSIPNRRHIITEDGTMAASTTQHFGPAPMGRVGRRTHNAAGHRRIKQSATLDDNGFFAVDMPIPTRLAQFLPVKGVEEQKTTRYTAVTTDPDELPTSGFRLRQNTFDPPRQTELFIVITMYNEDAELFCRTLYGVMKNIAHLCGRKNSRVWGKDGWQKVVVCIVADGRKAVNPRVLDCLAALGVYQEGAMTNMVKDRPVTAHVFQYTTSFAISGDLNFKYPDKGIVPCQIIFCLKEKNAKKINSHRWFFNAFAPLLSPNVCVLLDVGTRPEPKSLYYLWKAFDLNSNVGGACGEIATFKGKTWRSLLNPLVAAQCFEYKMSNILDKPMESLFGYCTVLPGAFSAYRWIALQNNHDGTGPLASYFQGEQLHTGKADTFTANIIWLRTVFYASRLSARRRRTGFSSLSNLPLRRRWLNGSFFAALYSLIHVAQVWRSDHSVLRKLALMLEFAYNALNLVFSWFSLANFYIFFVILTRALEDKAFGIPRIDILNTIAQVSCFIFGMGNRPQGSPWKYKATIYFFALLTTYMLVAAVLCTVQAIKHFDSPIFSRMVVSLISTYGIFIASSILALDPWHLVTCFIQFILFSPSEFPFHCCHDLSWGTKGSDTVQEVDLGAVQGVGKHVEVELVSAQQDIDIAYQDALDNIRLNKARVGPQETGPKKGNSEQAQKDTYANFRTNLLLCWSLTNALLASVILSGVSSNTFSAEGNTKTAVYMLVILIFVAGMAMFRFVCSTMYLVIRMFAG